MWNTAEKKVRAITEAIALWKDTGGRWMRPRSWRDLADDITGYQNVDRVLEQSVKAMLRAASHYMRRPLTEDEKSNLAIAWLNQYLADGDHPMLEDKSYARFRELTAKPERSITMFLMSVIEGDRLTFAKVQRKRETV